MAGKKSRRSTTSHRLTPRGKCISPLLFLVVQCFPPFSPFFYVFSLFSPFFSPSSFSLVSLLVLLLCLTRAYITVCTPRCTREEGGTYTYMDEGVSEGTWVYRVSDMSK